MIDEAITVIETQLRQHIERKFGVFHPSRVVVSNLIDQEGKVDIDGGKNRLVVSLIDIEETKLKSPTPVPKRIGSSGNLKMMSPPVHLSLYLLITSYFESSQIKESLQYLSEAITFFQSKSVFDQQNTPELIDFSIDKLILEIHNLNMQDKSHMWSMLGAKFMPSILYRVRMLTIQSDVPQLEVREVETIAVKKST